MTSNLIILSAFGITALVFGLKLVNQINERLELVAGVL